jgi:hypothetical protein
MVEYKKLSSPFRDESYARGTTLFMNGKAFITSLAVTWLGRQVLPALRISVLLPFIWNFFQPRKFLSVREFAL